jgi:hypothetical protein
MSSGRLVLIVAAVLASASLVAACGGTGGAGAGSGAAGIVPASAAAYIAIDTDLDSSQWQTVDELSRRFPDRQKAIDSITRDLRKEAGLGFEHDVKPALGPEIDVAWLDFDHNGQDVVGLLQPTDESAFERLVQKANEQDPQNKLIYGKVGDWHVVAETQTLIDRFRSESGAAQAMLADDSTFTGAMDAVPDESLVTAYIGGQQVMDAISEYAGEQGSNIVDEAGTLEWIVSAVHASSDGMRFDSVVRGTPGKLFRGVKPTPFHASLPDRVPGDALAYYTFHGTDGMLNGLSSAPQLATPELQPVAKALRSVASLLLGENALYVRPSSGQIPEITLVTEPKPGTDGAATLDHILGLYRSQLGITPEQTSIKGIPARKLDLGAFEIDYANVAGNLVVTSLPQGILSLGAPSSTLANNESFKDAVDKAGLPDKTQGFLYVNVRGGLDLATHLAGGQIPANVLGDLKPLRSALEYALTRPSELQITFFLRVD